MKFLLLFISTFFSVNILFAQSKVSDSLLNEICQSIKTSNETDDSVKVFKAFSLLNDIVGPMDDSSRSATIQYCFYRLQKTCVEFKNILDNHEKPKGDWQVVSSKPISKLEKKECRQILNYKILYYLEANGDTVNITMGNGYWVDNFKDGTHSKLKLNWINDCEFAIVFIESDNMVRKSFSKRGDTYFYQLIDKQDGFYNASVEIKETGQIATFRIYYK
jgi:hypothetical protein